MLISNPTREVTCKKGKKYVNVPVNTFLNHDQENLRQAN